MARGLVDSGYVTRLIKVQQSRGFILPLIKLVILKCWALVVFWFYHHIYRVTKILVFLYWPLFLANNVLITFNINIIVFPYFQLVHSIDRSLSTFRGELTCFYKPGSLTWFHKLSLKTIGCTQLLVSEINRYFKISIVS